MSVMVQPMAFLCFLRTDIRLSSCLIVKCDAMMSGRVSCLSKQTYLRCLGKSFNSMKGEHSMEGGVKFVGSKFGKIGLDAQLTADSTIWSRSKFINSNSNSLSVSSSNSSLCSLVLLSMRLTSKVWSSISLGYFSRLKTLTFLVISPKVNLMD